MKQKIIANILIGMLFFQFSFAQESQEIVTGKSVSITNLFRVQVRVTPSLDSEKTYTVMKGVEGELTGKVHVQDGMTWVEVKYGENITGWIHKTLVDVKSISYQTQIGKTYTVYYESKNKNEPLFLSSITTESGSTTPEIVWITTNLRTDIPDYANVPWGHSGSTTTVETPVDTPVVEGPVQQVNNFRTEIAQKTETPWVVAPEVSTVITTDVQEVQKEPVLITTTFRDDIPQKVERPWVKNDIFTGSTESTGSQVSTENTVTFQTFSFRQDYIERGNYPWIKEAYTGSIVTSTGTTATGNTLTVQTTRIGGELPDYWSMSPWIKNASVETTSTQTLDTTPQQSTGSTVTSSIFPSIPEDWTLYNFIFGK